MTSRFAGDDSATRGASSPWPQSRKRAAAATDGTPEPGPSYTELSGIRVYFIHVRVLPPTTTASRAGKATRVTVTHADLTNPDTT